MKEKLVKVRQEIDLLWDEASNYYGCRCGMDDVSAGDCWPCRMVSLGERASGCIALLDSITEALDSQEMVEKVARLLGGAFFDENSKGWEGPHALEMQEKFRIMARAAINTIQGMTE